MSKKSRYFLIIFFSTLFLISAPLLAVYTSGYRYNFQSKYWVKSGNLLIDSYPREAKILINGESQPTHWYDFLLFYKKFLGLVKRHGTTPGLIDNLLPEEHQIEVRKQGYQSWNKKIQVVSGQTASFKGIRLFLEKPKINLIDSGLVKQTWLSPSQEKMVYQIDSQDNNQQQKFKIWVDSKKIIDLNELLGKKIIIYQISQVFWSPNENQLLLTATTNLSQSNQYLVINLNDSRLINLQQSFPKLNFTLLSKQSIQHSLIKWSLTSDQILIARLNNTLYSLDLNNQQSRPIFQLGQGYLRDWIDQGDQIQILSFYQGTLWYGQYQLNDQLENKKVLFQGKISNIHLKFANYQPNGNWRLLKDPYQSEYILIKLGFNQIDSHSIINANQLKFNSDNHLFYWNNYELWQAWIDQEQNNPLQKEIISRSSYSILQVALFPEEKYLLYLASENNPSQNSQRLQAIEINSTSSQNNHCLLEAKTINLFLKPTQDKIILVGEINNQIGVFELKIH